MKLWAVLYGTIWVVFLEIWLAFTPIAPPVPYYAHALLGAGIVALTFRNARWLRSTTVPGRMKRIAAASFQLSVVMAVLGVALFVGFGSAWVVVPGISVLGILTFLHFVNALAILTQTSAVACAYDMWEEQEFAVGTAPGEVPPAPRPPTAPA